MPHKYISSCSWSTKEPVHSSAAQYSFLTNDKKIYCHSKSHPSGPFIDNRVDKLQTAGINYLSRKANMNYIRPKVAQDIWRP